MGVYVNPGNLGFSQIVADEYVDKTGLIVFVIDEWDAPLREAKDNEYAKEQWVKCLRTLFKNASFTSEAVACAYMTCDRADPREALPTSPCQLSRAASLGGHNIRHKNEVTFLCD